MAFPAAPSSGRIGRYACNASATEGCGCIVSVQIRNFARWTERCACTGPAWGAAPAPPQRAAPGVAVTASMTRSRLKLPGFCRGGNSLKLCSHSPTYAAAGAIMNMCSRYQRW